MINYNNGKIYKIEPINGEDGDVYIGSTTKELLSQRMTAHRYNYKKYLNGKYSNVTSFKLFEKYGVDNCNIILLESVNANNKDELLAREAHHIKTLSCVNRNIPLQTMKEYRESNRDALLIQMKAYNYANKDAILEYRKQYNKDNRDKINERQKVLRKLKKQQLTA